MAEHVLAVLLADVGEVVAAVDHAARLAPVRGAGEVLGVGEQRAPLRLQQVDDAEVLAALLELRAGGGQEVDVGVAGPPAAARPCRSCAGAAGSARAGRARSGRSRAAVRTRTRGPRRRPPRRAAASPGRCRRCRRTWLAEPHVAADVVVPAAEVLVDVVVVAVRLVRHAFGGAEVHAARHRLAGRVVEDGDVHPVAAGIDQLDPDPVGGCLTVALDVAPARPSRVRRLAVLTVDGRRRDGGDVRRRRGSPVVGVARAVAGPVVLAGRERLGVGRDAAVDLDVEHVVAAGQVGSVTTSRTGRAGVRTNGCSST